MFQKIVASLLSGQNPIFYRSDAFVFRDRSSILTSMNQRPSVELISTFRLIHSSGASTKLIASWPSRLVVSSSRWSALSNPPRLQGEREKSMHLRSALLCSAA